MDGASSNMVQIRKKLWLEILKVRDHLEELSVDGDIIKMNLKERG
jgi:hypothetical protein